MYYDFTSLYPAMGKYRPQVIGHPTVYNKQQCVNLNFSNLHGFIKSKILPPQDKFHPNLPVKMFDRMVTPLSRTCAEKQMYPCTHNDENDRALTGTWVLAEVNYAIEKKRLPYA